MTITGARADEPKGPGLVVAGGLRAPEGAPSGALSRPRHGPATLVLDLPGRTFVALPQLTAGEVCLVASGELDLATLAPLREALEIALGYRPARVTLDLRRVDFIDARSAGVIAITAARIDEWDGTIALRHPKAPVRRVLRLCRLDHLLEPRWRGRAPRRGDG
jgi:anti-anti-sigma factor